ncbi:beta-N-acetylglucosaminidase [Planomicrobium koreense]|uniref:Beta-N-acetylglucosaminidase n=2 Tax=Planococcus koreensis TaxID=112331 RepID=A0A7W8CSJ5_9BACL|nr:S-layer homology domain-containing protein [Planococcus koreensis]MBB5179417.1 beta-N-acetylglucosaminidase [Planococcus koreensis]
MRKLMLLLIMATMVISIAAPLHTKAADDLTGHPYEKEMRELMELGIITGYDDGSIRPEREVTRAEFAKMVILSFELGTDAASAEFKSAAVASNTTGLTASFKDVPMDKWFYNPIMQAAEAGIVTGYPDNTFGPNDPITREQMATMVSRALTAKGYTLTEGEAAPLDFKDLSTILKVHVGDVQILTHLGIVKGNDDGTFKPKDSSKRWMVALVMLRGRELVFPPTPLEFQASAVSAEKTTVLKHFETFEEAKSYVKTNSAATAVERSNQIVWMEKGIAVTNKFTEIYPTTDLKVMASQFRPYVPAQTEMKYLDATAGTVKVELAGKVGYVSQDSINQIPEVMKKGQSYYEVSQYGSLIHYLYNHSTGKTVSMGVIGKAPAQMAVGKKYYSWDGANFTDETGNKVTEAHQYFNKLPLYTPSNYSAQELDKFLVDLFPYYNKLQAGKTWTTSPLAGTGKFFKEMESTYKVNALYLMAHAIHESGWGTSKIAQDKFNLYGYGAVDADPYNGAYSYATFRESIEYAAQKINANYHTVTASYYNGSVLGHKGVGMNVRYASDPFWGEKIAGHMYRADINLGGKDINKMALGETTTSGLNFRKDASTLYAPLYKLEMAGIPAVIKGTVQAASNGATWYNVQSENKLYNDAFVHGAYLRELPTAK